MGSDESHGVLVTLRDKVTRQYPQPPAQLLKWKGSRSRFEPRSLALLTSHALLLGQTGSQALTTSWKKGAAGKPVTRSRLGCALLTPALRASFQFQAPSPRVPRSLKNNNLTYHSSWKSLGIDFCFCFCCCCQSFFFFSIHRLYWTDWPLPLAPSAFQNCFLTSQYHSWAWWYWCTGCPYQVL